jgi:hypothetical protein
MQRAWSQVGPPYPVKSSGSGSPLIPVRADSRPGLTQKKSVSAWLGLKKNQRVKQKLKSELIEWTLPRTEQRAKLEVSKKNQESVQHLSQDN